MKAIVLHSVVPVRAEASEGSEQLTQLLFAQTCSVLEEKPRWKRIHNDEDGQEGWVDFKMITPLNEQEEQEMLTADKRARVSMPMAYAVSENNGQTIPLTGGTCLPNYKDGHFSLLGVGFRIDPSMVVSAPLVMSEQILMQVVRFYLNVPYLWGGKNAMGMDCSGFTQVIYSLFGHSLLRNASEQMTQGESVATLSEAKAGDLVFFDHHDERISHVGLLLDGQRVIHCSGRVKVEKIDEEGIFSAEQGGIYTHHLVGIKRMG